MVKRLLLLVLLTSSLFAAAVTVSGPLYKPDGVTLANGSITITSPNFTGADGHYHPATTRVVNVTAGVFSQLLEPSNNSSPHFSYKITYKFGSTSPAQCSWVVSTSNTTIPDIETCPAPASSVPATGISLSQISAGGGADGSCVLVTGGVLATGTCNQNWTATGNDIYSANTGNVGVGGAPGNYKFDVKKSGSSGTAQFYDQTAVTGITGINIRAGAGQSINALVSYRINDGTLAGQVGPDGSFGQFVSGNRKTISFSTYFGLSSDSLVLWRSATSWDSGSIDTGLGRNAAGVVEVNNGTLGTFRDMKFRNLTLTGITGATQCLHVNTIGLVTGTGADCGSGGGGGGSVFTGSTATATTGITGTAANPIFDLGDQSVKSPVRFEPAALAANVNSVTFIGKTAGAKFSIPWLQNGTGSSTVTYGASASNTCAISTTANKTTTQFFEVKADGTTVVGVGCVSDDALDTPVSGPVSATSGDVPTFGDATGKLIADSGILATNLVRKDAANTFTTGAQDFGGALSLKIPVSAGITTTTNGFIAYDSSADMLHASQGGADAKIPQFTITPLNGECVNWVVSGSNYKLGSAGAACGSGGGGSSGGSIVPKTTNYQVTLLDGGKIFTFSGTSLTATLVATVPAMPFIIGIKNLDSTDLTIARNGNTINGGSSDLVLKQYQEVACEADTATGNNYVCGTPVLGSTTVSVTQSAIGQTLAVPATAPLITTGIHDGLAPITITTGATATLGAGTYSTGYTYNQETTAGTAVTYTLPATAAGKQYCVKNSDVTGTARTSVLTVAVPTSSYLHMDGVRGTISSNITSGGAAGDGACFVAIDATNWEVYVNKGTWTLH